MTDHDHDHHHHGGGPGLGLVLLIPAALIVAKTAARHRRATWGPAWGLSGPGDLGFGHRGPFGAGDVPGDAEGSFRLPPKIEWMLDTWHKRAHQQDEPTEPDTAS
jgi:hypothetical protein